MRTCCYCEGEFEDDDCRPYGPKAAMTCFPCAMLSENRPTTDEMLTRKIDGLLDEGGPIYIGGVDGPSVVPPPSESLFGIVIPSGPPVLKN